MSEKKVYLGIDIGAGLGAKLGLFPKVHSAVAESLLPVDQYGGTFGGFTDSLIEATEKLLSENSLTMQDVRSIGIACPGILGSDGSFQLVQNLSDFTGHNLKAALRERLNLPVDIENDANAGALAEWSVLRVETLYWVFGGGWGGAWVSRDGRVQFPSHDWDGNDASLHYTNEPGYAIPLDKIMLTTLFQEVNASFERFMQNLREEFAGNPAAALGPSASPDSLRAETLLSGPGRCRIFRAIVGDDDFYERFLDIHETRGMNDPAIAGQHISKLSSMRVEAAVKSDRLYGKILAQATRIMIKAAYRDGMAEGIPICLGGKPSYALPYFGPSAQRAMGKLGLMNYLRPSVIDERGCNANLVGAAVLAEKAWKKSK
ncbi:MAG: ROK family protein [Phycisphaerae bacterium]|nr:ROK family protein [Phycisphaerae bacterium]